LRWENGKRGDKNFVRLNERKRNNGMKARARFLGKGYHDEVWWRAEVGFEEGNHRAN